MKTLFENARILTMADGPIPFEGYFGIEGDAIVYVGKEKPSDPYEETVDCQGALLFPGFKNAHTHSAMIAMRGVGEGLPLMEWLQKIFAVEAKLTPDDVYWLSKGAFLEYARSGINCFFDMYFFAPMIAKAAEDFGMRGANLFMLDDQGERIPSFLKELSRNDDPHSLVKTVLGFHAEYTVGTNEFEWVKKLSKQYHLPVFTHLSETDDEVKQCEARRGCTPVEFLDRNGLFDFGGGGYHCIHFRPKDDAIFASKRLHLVSCPCSNEKLRDGTADLLRYQTEGIEVSFGTDGASSNYSLSFFKELRLGKKNNPGLSDFDLLTMATVHGARACLLDECDCLAVGKKADFVLLGASSVEEIVNEGSDSMVLATYVAGKRLKTEDPEIEARCAAITKRLLGK